MEYMLKQMGGLDMNVRWSLWLLIVAVLLLPAAPAVGQEQESEKVHILGDEKWVNAARERLDRAAQRANDGKYEDALKDLLWCLKNSPDPFPEIQQSVPRYAVRRLYLMSKTSPAVEKAYKKRRADHEKAFREGKGTLARAVELDAMYQAQGDWAKMQELYEEFVEQGKDGRKMRELLHMFVEEGLLEDGKYEELLKGAGKGPSSLEARLPKLEEDFAKLQNVDEKVKDAAKLNLCRSGGRYYQAMLRLKKDREAEALAEGMLEYHPKGATYAWFIRNAALAENYDAARELVKQAKRELKDKDEELAAVKAEERHLPKVKKSSKSEQSEEKGRKSSKKKETDAVGTARQFAELLTKGKYAEAAKMYDETMAKALPVEMLKATWEQMTAAAGKFESLGKPKTSKEGGHDVVVIPAKFKNFSLNLRIVVNNKRQVAGFFIQPDEASTPG